MSNIENTLELLKIGLSPIYSDKNKNALKNYFDTISNNIDLLYGKSYRDKIKVENGLKNIYRKFNLEVIGHVHLLSNKYKTKNLYCVGHSMGSICNLLALDLYFIDPEYYNIKIVTLGGPRIGNGYFSEIMFNTNIYNLRIVDNLDIVAQIPPQNEHNKLTKYIMSHALNKEKLELKFKNSKLKKKLESFLYKRSLNKNKKYNHVGKQIWYYKGNIHVLHIFDYVENSYGLLKLKKCGISDHMNYFLEANEE